MAQLPAWPRDQAVCRATRKVCPDEVQAPSSSRPLTRRWSALARPSPAPPRPRHAPRPAPKQAFSPWGDQRNYVLAPDGGFEAGAQGWELAGGATVVAGNESYYLNDAGDTQLAVAARRQLGGQPAGLHGDRHPGLPDDGPQHGRPALAAAGDGQLQAARPAPHPDGRHRHRRLRPGRRPLPQSTVLTLSTIVGTLIPSAIEIRVTPLDSKGNWQVDDLYIDPFARR